jgi:hypothetical protein
MANEPAGTAETRRRIAEDPRARELTDRLREFYRLCDQEPRAGELCRAWGRSRQIASDLVIEWEPVASHIRGSAAGARPDDPDALLRALRGLVRVDGGQDEQRMVVRLLARALYELMELRQRVPSADELCRCWDRCEDLARELTLRYDARVTFRDAERWRADVAGGADRVELLEQPWMVGD